jgi:deoxyribose-phosphate aldolase
MKAETHHQVITVADIQRAKGQIEISENTIITPSARDLAASLGIQLVPVKQADLTIKDSAQTISQSRKHVISSRKLSAYIEHSNLPPHASREDIIRLCDEAITHGFAAVCVNPIRIADAAARLEGNSVAVCGVVGFPTGAHDKALKAAEAAVCVEQGATEIDMVANTGLLHDDRVDLYHADIRAVRTAVGPDIILKVIIEAPLLNPEDVVRAATTAASAGADYVKTSTGVYAQARLEDVVLLRRALPANIKIKAAGGIRTAEFAHALIAAGADRLGTSASVAIVSGE